MGRCKKVTTWGYILLMPGRPKAAEQKRVLAALGVDTGATGTAWTDHLTKAKRHRDAGRKQLEERNALLVAGQTVRLKNMGKFSGKYLVRQARHEYRSNSGYTTELEIKMIEYIDDEEQQDAANA